MIIKILKKLIDKIFMYARGIWRTSYLINVNKTNFKKNCLLMYITEPFYTGESHSHQNQKQVVEIARIISSFGYNVDVIDYNNDRIFLNKNYDLVFDLYPGFNLIYQNHMNLGCKVIAYLTGSNLSFAKKQERIRIDNLFKRKGKTLKLRRTEGAIDLSYQEMKKMSAVFFMGNSYNWKTYTEFNIKKVYFIKNCGYKFDDIKKNRRDKRNFLFLGSYGQVHKGLDLLLEVFAEKNFNFNLYICSSFKEEKDFCTLYEKELFCTKNIYPVGFLDIYSNKFKELLEICRFLILPSCSEGLAGSVLTGMSAGLIPIVSKECGFEDDEVIHLKDCELDTIKAAVLQYGNKNEAWYIEEEAKAIQIVKRRYTMDDFSKSFFNAMKDVCE